MIDIHFLDSRVYISHEDLFNIIDEAEMIPWQGSTAWFVSVIILNRVILKRDSFLYSGFRFLIHLNNITLLETDQ